ncbi:hypothetical protein UFOVP252_41 [uncultured Caudovirales phage]|uniref:Uncharacterized protein n=1 Tax=uncultured Caudovirales phage TaxID=2100421 RepID=A0A6J5LIC2_9CAUD|nr:hypothetical protein UFOVP252_41 [uncultured Caudovirales phage]
MTSWIPLLVTAMIANAVTVFVIFAPPAHKVFNNHPECSIASFSPDLNSKQKAFCREWSKK